MIFSRCKLLVTPVIIALFWSLLVVCDAQSLQRDARHDNDGIMTARDRAVRGRDSHITISQTQGGADPLVLDKRQESETVEEVATEALPENTKTWKSRLTQAASAGYDSLVKTRNAFTTALQRGRSTLSAASKTEVPERLRSWRIFDDKGRFRNGVRNAYISVLSQIDKVREPIPEFSKLQKQWRYFPDLRKQYVIPRILRIPVIVQETPIPHGKEFYTYIKGVDPKHGLTRVTEDSLPHLSRIYGEEEETEKLTPNTVGGTSQVDNGGGVGLAETAATETRPDVELVNSKALHRESSFGEFGKEPKLSDEVKGEGMELKAIHEGEEDDTIPVVRQESDLGETSGTKETDTLSTKSAKSAKFTDPAVTTSDDADSSQLNLYTTYLSKVRHRYLKVAKFQEDQARKAGQRYPWYDGESPEPASHVSTDGEPHSVSVPVQAESDLPVEARTDDTVATPEDAPSHTPPLSRPRTPPEPYLESQLRSGPSTPHISPSAPSSPQHVTISGTTTPRTSSLHAEEVIAAEPSHSEGTPTIFPPDYAQVLFGHRNNIHDDEEAHSDAAADALHGEEEHLAGTEVGFRAGKGSPQWHKEASDSVFLSPTAEEEVQRSLARLREYQRYITSFRQADDGQPRVPYLPPLPNAPGFAGGAGSAVSRFRPGSVVSIPGQVRLPSESIITPKYSADSEESLDATSSRGSSILDDGRTGSGRTSLENAEPSDKENMFGHGSGSGIRLFTLGQSPERVPAHQQDLRAAAEHYVSRLNSKSRGIGGQAGFIRQRKRPSDSLAATRKGVRFRDDGDGESFDGGESENTATTRRPPLRHLPSFDFGTSARLLSPTPRLRGPNPELQRYLDSLKSVPTPLSSTESDSGIPRPRLTSTAERQHIDSSDDSSHQPAPQFHSP
ncbi:hypothetical protein BCV70DRAFT_700 [Testicularia cyperi]|uniref:Uncharacterized protein n=1 Tax=Testicularia cyperi TaxID=1882483 RepID=A0A317XX13_9BASI|nr:hypothetical protein BCV70DRAFT_700 [Testicularia cyperi]